MTGFPGGYPDNWPSLDGESLTLEVLAELLAKRNAWCAQVDALGIDAPPIPTTVDEERAIREAKACLRATILVTETERFLEDPS